MQFKPGDKGIICFQPIIYFSFGFGEIELVFVPDNDIPAGTVVTFDDKLLRQFAKIYFIKRVIDAQKRNEIFFADFFLNPFSDLVFVGKTGFERRRIV